MRLRVLLSGLTFFALALALGALPALAHAHPLNPWKPCTQTGTAGDDYDGTHDHLNGGRGYDRTPRRDRALDYFYSIESFS